MADFVDVDPRLAIAVLSEELQRINENRMYLLAVIKQMETNAEQEREAWELKFASVNKKVQEETAEE